MWQDILNFFNHPFFIIIGGLTTIVAILGVLYTFYLILKGVLPVWYRLGIGLSKRKISVFADTEYDNLKSMLVDSKIFKEKNIIKIDIKSIKKATFTSLLLLHWKYAQSEIDNILRIKNDSDALIIYAPQEEGFLSKDVLEKINKERNTIIVNFRGRLLNDILTTMITTNYEKRKI
jgi:hypothetical protein